jgi:hypothetical protein
VKAAFLPYGTDSIFGKGSQMIVSCPIATLSIRVRLAYIQEEGTEWERPLYTLFVKELWLPTGEEAIKQVITNSLAGHQNLQSCRTERRIQEDE